MASGSYSSAHALRLQREAFCNRQEKPANVEAGRLESRGAGRLAARQTRPLVPQARTG